MRTKPWASARTLGSSAKWSNTSAAKFISATATRPTASAFHSACRTACGTRAWSRAPTIWATIGLMAIITPSTVVVVM